MPNTWDEKEAGKAMTPDYTVEQLEVIEKMLQYSQNFADQILHIMKNHKLDLVDGCSLKISVEPAYSLISNQIRFGHVDKPSGIVHVTRGINERNYMPVGLNSAVYEEMYIPEGFKRDKELPPDGLWV